MIRNGHLRSGLVLDTDLYAGRVFSGRPAYTNHDRLAGWDALP